jgi:hypothetical protein
MDHFHPAHRTPDPEPELLPLADFKWLMMACEGHRLDLDRMQTDRDYALQSVKLGLQARDSVVRDCARVLLEQLQPERPASPAVSTLTP